ncbi:hypothetical protein D3C85_457400 [compost metagenome]
MNVKFPAVETTVCNTALLASLNSTVTSGTKADPFFTEPAILTVPGTTLPKEVSTWFNNAFGIEPLVS